MKNAALLLIPLLLAACRPAETPSPESAAAVVFPTGAFIDLTWTGGFADDRPKTKSPY